MSRQSGKTYATIQTINDKLERLRASGPHPLMHPETAARVRDVFLFGIDVVESGYMSKGVVFIATKTDIDGTIDTRKIINLE